MKILKKKMEMTNQFHIFNPSPTVKDSPFVFFRKNGVTNNKIVSKDSSVLQMKKTLVDDRKETIENNSGLKITKTKKKEPEKLASIIKVSPVDKL